MIWTLYGAMVRHSGDSIYLRYLQEVTWNSHLSAWEKRSVSAESVEYFLNVEFVLRNVVRIDEDVIQIYDDYDVDHICKNVIHKYLKSGGCISKPFRHYQPLKGTVVGSECSLPFVSR